MVAQNRLEVAFCDSRQLAGAICEIFVYALGGERNGRIGNLWRNGFFNNPFGRLAGAGSTILRSLLCHDFTEAAFCANSDFGGVNLELFVFRYIENNLPKDQTVLLRLFTLC